MRCTNKKKRIVVALLASVLVLPLAGCSAAPALENAFEADRPGLGVTASLDGGEGISYFAEDLCVVDENVEAIEADTSEALAACFFDMDSLEVLYAQNVHDRMYPASTTKIMTALVALEHGDLDAQATVSETAVTFHESGVTTAHLKTGDMLTLRQLLYALLVCSANDAANVIAEQVGGSIEGFVDMMNEEAARIGATNTHFTNPHGLHDEEHYTTAYDMYLMFQEALKKDLLAKLDEMRKMAAFIEDRSPQIMAEYRQKLEAKVQDLLSDAQTDEGRIAMEVTLFADKICVDEEIVRLRSHVEATKEALEAGGSIGRKLDFIAQEMNREANTTLSKANDLEISNCAIDLKTEIEKVREQIQNIE